MNESNLKNRLKLSSPLLLRLAELWRWWIDELVGILPRGIRAATGPNAAHLYLQPDDAEVMVSQGTNAAAQIGHYPFVEEALPQAQARVVEDLVRQSREVILILPADKVLLKTLSLPQVAETNLREVLGFEMDRQTPFSLNQVYYDHILSRRDPKTNTLSVELVVTPRSYLDELLGKLRDIGFEPHQVTLTQTGGDQALPVNLLPEESRQQRRESGRALNLALGILALALLAAIISIPLMNKFKLIDTLESRVEVTTRKAEIVQRLSEDVEVLSTGTDFLLKKKQITPLTLEVLNELTHILPDDTWINNLTVKGKEVQIQGFSSAAAALIPLIESSDHLQNPRFRSSVTSAAGSDSERFHLSAEISGRSIK